MYVCVYDVIIPMVLGRSVTTEIIAVQWPYSASARYCYSKVPALDCIR